MLFRLLILSFFWLTPVLCQQCYVLGSVEGIFHDAHVVTSYNECLNYCKNDTDCKCFTYYQDNNDCAEFTFCSALDISCTTCYSGEPECSEEIRCDIDGLCNGVLIELTITESEADCLARCKEVTDCEFYAYRGDDGNCALLEDCSDVFPCGECHSGEKDCSISIEGKMRKSEILPECILRAITILDLILFNSVLFGITQYNSVFL